ncbi:MAG TPA: FCD domain-containing protein [Casimicrobiaceae bacterium]|nr:FCD domain-containing protein [Casimicrobiaceae bacterium]
MSGPAPDRRSESFVLRVQRELERAIAAGELRGGDRINESSLAIKLGMSRGPVREACRTLEQTGVLRSAINRGFFVREITTREALDLYDLRAKLHGMAGRLAAGSVTGAQLHELDALVDRMDEAVEGEDIGAFYPLNCEFHTLIVACADNHKLTQLWPNLESELHLFRRRGLVLPGSLRISNYDHRAMVAALRAGDAATAERVMEQHIQSGKARLLKTLGAHDNGAAKRRAANV